MIQVSDLVRYHNNNVGTGKSGRKGKSRRERIKPVSEYQLDFPAWAPHVEKFLSDRMVVRPRQILDLVGFPPEKLTPEVGHYIDKAKELLTQLGWEQMPAPHSYDWAPSDLVKKARQKKRAPQRSPELIAKHARGVLRFLKKGGMYSLPELQKEFSFSRSQMRAMVSTLVEQGKVLTLGQSSQTMYYHP